MDTLQNVMYIVFFWPAAVLELWIMFLKGSKALWHFGTFYLLAQSSGGCCSIWNCVQRWAFLSMLVLKTALSLKVLNCSSSLLTELCHWPICVSHDTDFWYSTRYSSKSDIIFQVVKAALWLPAPFTSAKKSAKFFVGHMKIEILTWTVSVHQMHNVADKTDQNDGAWS